MAHAGTVDDRVFTLVYQALEHVPHFRVGRLQAVQHLARVAGQLAPQASQRGVQRCLHFRSMQCVVHLAGNQYQFTDAFRSGDARHDVQVLLAHELRRRADDKHNVAALQQIMGTRFARRHRIIQPRGIDDAQSTQRFHRHLDVYALGHRHVAALSGNVAPQQHRQFLQIRS
ncbi:hypothetical protein D3C73_722220 [compost metagenome]